jgi:hypothetical protein
MLHVRLREEDRLLGWWGAADAAPAIIAAIRSRDLPVLPVLAWMLLDGVRRGCPDAGVDTDVLAHLGLILDRWELRHGLLDAATPAGTLAQVLHVQELHCLADLCVHVGQQWASGPWSRRGHRMEAAVHARLWDGRNYHAPGDGPADGLTVPLLLDTPADRVDRIAAVALDTCRAAWASGCPAAVVRLVSEGLRRHRRHEAVAVELMARLNA